MYNVVTTLASSSLIGSSLFFVGNEDNHNSLTKFEFLPAPTRTAGLSALEHLEISSIDLQWGKCCDHASGFIFEWIFFCLAGNMDNH